MRKEKNIPYANQVVREVLDGDANITKDELMEAIETLDNGGYTCESGYTRRGGQWVIDVNNAFKRNKVGEKSKPFSGGII